LLEAGERVTSDLRWVLLYTKQHAEPWAEINLRKQGFSTLLPRVRARGGLAPLFPRYLLAGHEENRVASAMQHTLGVMYVVRCGAHAARVPHDVIAEIYGRMDASGIVTLDTGPAPDPLFAAQQRKRLQALQKFAEAGFRVRVA
jgi:hypothetical protein